MGLVFQATLRIYILTLTLVVVVIGKGLECDICHRSGDDGDRSCDRKPCNTPDDVEAQMHHPGNQAQFQGLDKTRTNCVKVVKTQNLTRVSFPINGPWKMGEIDVIQLPILEAYCAFADTGFPPRNESYPNYLESEPPGIKVDSYHVCDEENVENCRVSNDELNRGVGYSFYTRAGQPGIWTTAYGDGGLWLPNENWPIQFLGPSPEVWMDHTKFKPVIKGMDKENAGENSKLEDNNSADSKTMKFIILQSMAGQWP